MAVSAGEDSLTLGVFCILSRSIGGGGVGHGSRFVLKRGCASDHDDGKYRLSSLNSSIISRCEAPRAHRAVFCT